MKSSDLYKASRLAQDEKKLRAMLDMATGFPNTPGYLSVGGEVYHLRRGEVERILDAEIKRISDEAANIGLEFDE